ncbi:CPBP family intramembrane metalloprotease [bacterium]|nr:CPBP family intramembrane metalloprotease [bacterium]
MKLAKTCNLIKQYLIGIEFKAAIVLIGSPFLLTVHRYYVKSAFFRKTFGQYFQDSPYASIYPYYYWFLVSSITLMLIPIVLIKFGIREKIKDYGFQFNRPKLGWSFVTVGFLVMLPIVLIASHLPSFQNKYPLCKLAATNWTIFIPYQLAFGVYILSWEFFFRGYMLFGLEEQFGKYSILIQMIPFTILHHGKPFAESVGAILAGILLGVIALETRSFIYGALLHWLVAVSMDAFVILLKIR